MQRAKAEACIFLVNQLTFMEAMELWAPRLAPAPDLHLLNNIGAPTMWYFVFLEMVQQGRG